MAGIWTTKDSGWELARPQLFRDEEALHGLIAETPEMLPLAGAPKFIVIGSEVQLGSGYADLIGVELSGRLAVIEVKLARNTEAKRAVVSQVLAYAAYLHGMSTAQLEEGPLRRSLDSAGHKTVLDAIAAADQEGALEAEAFSIGLQDSLSDGRFRLILVLDDVPPELVRLVGYLEHVSTGLLIDLITISRFEIGGRQLLLVDRLHLGLPHL